MQIRCYDGASVLEMDWGWDNRYLVVYIASSCTLITGEEYND